MLERRALPAGGFFMALVLALATVGVGYGLWSKTLRIVGTVRTGEVDAVLSLEEVDESRDFNARYCPESEGQYSIGLDCDDDGSLNDSFEMEEEGKDVASCSATLVDSGQFPDVANAGPQGLAIRINSAYPSFNCFVQFNVQNTGTIPIKVNQPDAYQCTDPAVFTTCTLLTGAPVFGGNFGQVGQDYVFHLNSWPPTIHGQTCYLDDIQLEPPIPGEPPVPGEFALCNLHFHLGQLAQQGGTYRFLVTILAHQWNEDA